MSLGQNPAVAAMNRRQKVRILIGSIVRTVIGMLFIWLCLSIVPEKPATKGFLPLVLVIGGVSLYIWFFRRQMRDIRVAQYPTLRAVEAIILAAMMFLAIFAAFYVMISANEPSAFSEPLDHFTAYYFALTVLATVGFGDITPVTMFARLVCMVQMAIDIALIGILVRVLSGAARQGLDAIKSRQPSDPA